ncbi:MAG: hypothetical protein AABY83_13860 [Pseudomonadota bacterium]
MDAQNYVGIYDDKYGGMTHLGQIIKDAWLFGIIPETETGAGWAQGQMQLVYDKVSARWDEFGHLPSHLSPELRERHTRIYEEAIKRARAAGWDPVLGEDD